MSVSTQTTNLKFQDLLRHICIEDDATMPNEFASNILFISIFVEKICKTCLVTACRFINEVREWTCLFCGPV